MSRTMAVDLGAARTGVAVSDELGMLAQPWKTVPGGAASLEAVIAAAGELKPGRILVGLPRNMDGSEGPRCQSTRAFARNLARMTDLPIGFWDERLSTVAAERALLEADTSRKRRAEVIDHVAAAFILQGALDRLRILTPRDDD